jgi:dTMP kinase
MADSLELQLLLWKAMASIGLSPSHDTWHIDCVLSYAAHLEALYGGDREVITAAVILHDIGRSNALLRGDHNVAVSTNQARQLLERVSLPTWKIDHILTAIAEHDQPQSSPSSLEGRILKDADILAGLGAIGILRMAMWAGETGGGLAKFLAATGTTLPARIAGLEFPESRRIAKREMSFARLFVSLVSQAPRANFMRQNGAYIIIEGISGSGKDTQAQRINERLSALGRRVVMVSEPTSLYTKLRNHFNPSNIDLAVKSLLLMADRYQQIQNVVLPALQQDGIVISTRSYLSALVYQSSDSVQQSNMDYFHMFVPTPDLVFILDISAEEALHRIGRRAELEARALGEHEHPALLQQHRAKYLELAGTRATEDFLVINADKPVADVEADIWHHLVTKLPQLYNSH